MFAGQLRTNHSRTRFLGSFVSDTLYLARLYDRVIARERRLIIGIFCNVAFSLLTAYVLVNLFQFYMVGGLALIGMLFIIAVSIGLFNEFFNLINCNFEDNIYSAGSSVIFPVSRPALFLKILVNDMIGVRGIFYAAPSLVILYYSIAFHPKTFLFAVAAVVLFYLAASVMYAAVDYGYGFVKYKYGRNVEKIIVFGVFSLSALIWLASKFGWLTYPEINSVVRHFTGILVRKHA